MSKARLPLLPRPRAARYTGCYVDCSKAVFVNPSFTTWTDGIVLGGAGIEIQGGTIDSFRLTNTQFDGGRITFTGAQPPNVTMTDISGNVGYIGHAGIPVATTRASLSISSSVARTIWLFDFCDRLVFGQIRSVASVSLTAVHPASPVVVARPPVGCMVNISVQPATAGTLVVNVDESLEGPKPW